MAGFGGLAVSVGGTSMRTVALCRCAVASLLAAVLLAYAGSPANTALAADPSPTPTPTKPKASKQAKDLAEDIKVYSAEDAAALVAASKALAKARADLMVAQQALATAQAALAKAKLVAAQAQTDLDAAVLAEERAIRELADVQARLDERRQDLGRLARTAYESSGSMGEWAIVLSSTTPEQLADRLAFLQSVGSASNALIARLSEDRAELVNARQRLMAAREVAAGRWDAAERAVRDLTAKELLAAAAKQQVQTVVAAREAAFAAAKTAAIEDKRRYQVLIVQSGALGRRILDLSAELARGEKPPEGTGKFVRPGTGELTSPYGPRFHPILQYVKLHTGMDIGAGDGIVYAVDDGVVLFTEFNVAYGNMTVIDHGRLGKRNVSTLYAHQAAVGIKPGDRVQKGQAIGVVGSTGYSTGPHIHLEVRVDGEPVDPAPFLINATLPESARP